MLVTFDVSKPETSSVVRPEHASNMRLMFVTFVVTKVAGNAIVWRDRQPANIVSIVVTEPVAKLSSSVRFCSLLQPKNMPHMSITLDVSNELRSRDVRPMQPSNIFAMVVTLDVSNELRSRAVRPEHAWNISRMSVTFAVVKLPPSVMPVTW